MINDKFNNDSNGGLKSKLRDKKFISIVAIGIFVLILAIVLIAKGCSGSKTETQPEVKPTENITEVEEYPESAPKAETDEERGRKLLQEGKNYYNGAGDKPLDYAKAKECFTEAKNLGIKDAEVWLNSCENKLNKNRKK